MALWTSMLTSLLLVLFRFSSTLAQAAPPSYLYLPLVTKAPVVQPSLNFKTENVRLWNRFENGGSQDSYCGNKHLLQVDVFDKYGQSVLTIDQAIAPMKSLSGVTLEVINEQKNAITKQLLVTDPEGVIKVSIGEHAAVRVVTDAHDDPVASELVPVTTVTAEIPYHFLIEALYCQDEQSCKQFVNENACQGRFSWGVVFKQSE